jgi:hypothetical protein
VCIVRGPSTPDEAARGVEHVPVESDGHNEGNPRMYELIENAPKTGKSPTVWAFPEFVDFLKVAGQPVQGPWPPHQEPRPDPTAAESGPVAIPDPASFPRNDTRDQSRNGDSSDGHPGGAQSGETI